jgi:hypothetical protein
MRCLLGQRLVVHIVGLSKHGEKKKKKKFHCERENPIVFARSLSNGSFFDKDVSASARLSEDSVKPAKNSLFYLERRATVGRPGLNLRRCFLGTEVYPMIFSSKPLSNDHESSYI